MRSMLRVRSVIRLTLTILLLCGLSYGVGAPPRATQDTGGVSGAGSFSFSAISPASASGSLLTITIVLQSTTTTVSSVTSATCTGGAPAFTPLTITGTGIEVIFLYAANGPASCTSFTVNLSASTTGEATYAEYTGVATSSALDCDSYGNGSSTTLSTTTNCSANCTNDVVVVKGGILTGSDTYTLDDSYTIVIQRGGGSESEVLEDKNQTASGTISAAPTVGSTGQYAILAAAFKTTSSSCGGGSVVRHRAQVINQ